jgi:hypothetical protein
MELAEDWQALMLLVLDLKVLLPEHWVICVIEICLHAFTI